LKINGEPARQVKPRKRAADFLSDNEENEAEDAIETKVEAEKKSSNKKTKKADGTAAPAPTEKTNKPKNDTKAKGNTKVKKPEIVAEESDDDEMEDKESASSDASAEDEDDRTVALIRGFESSGDEDESGDEGLNPDGPIPKIPDSKKAKRKILKKQKENKQEADEPGTVYVG
jgi:nucleolar protein 15